MALASSPAMENRLRNSTPYSSTVLRRDVATRQWASSSLYEDATAASACVFSGAKTPRTVFVFPTSMTNSMIFRSAPVLFLYRSYRAAQHGPHSVRGQYLQETAPIKALRRSLEGRAVFLDADFLSVHP